MKNNNKNDNNFPDYRPNGRRMSPLNTKWKSRAETFACLIHSSSIILLPALFFYLWTIPKVWPLLIIYSFYSYVLDDTLSTGESFHRQWSYMKNLWIYREFINYFPIIIHRTVPLPKSLETVEMDKDCYPSWTFGLSKSARLILSKLHIIKIKNRKITIEKDIGPKYLFTYHPHGVIAFGITGAMCYDGNNNNTKPWKTGSLLSSNNFQSLFPNIKAHLLTLTTQFSLPFYRDYIMGLGVGLVTKKCIKSIFKAGHSAVIVVGGAHESLLAKPGKNSIVLNRRKGFIKIAIESSLNSDADCKLSDVQFQSNINDGTWESSMGNIAIVPIYGFGENNIHKVYDTTSAKSNFVNLMLKFQLLLKNSLGFTLPLVNSRAVFNYDFGLLPFRRQIDLVYGRPIYILRKFGNKPGDKVSDSEIDYYHNIYKDQLLKLWNQNKNFKTEWDQDLIFVE